MHRLGSVHERARDPEALHRRHRLGPDQSALSDAADDHLPAGVDRPRHALHGAKQAVPRHGVGLVEPRDVREGGGLGGEDMHGSGQEEDVFGVVDQARWGQGEGSFAFERSVC